MAMTRPTKLLLGGALFTLMFLYWSTATWYEWLIFTSTSECGLETTREDNKVLIAQINLENYSPVLHPGDEIMGVKELPGIPPQALMDGTVNLPPGIAATFLIKCKGQIHEVPLTTQPIPFSKKLQSIARILTPWIFFFTGLIVLLLKSDEPQAWLLAIMLGAFIGLFGSRANDLPVWLSATFAVTRGLGTLFVPVFFNFFLVFPKRSFLLPRFPRLEQWLYAPFFILILPFELFVRLGPLTKNLLETIPLWILRTLNRVSMIFILSYLIAGMVALVRNYRGAGREEKRKLHLIVAGCSLGIINVLLIVAVENIGQKGALKDFYGWLQTATNFTIPLIPISFAYAIIKHQVIPISLIIRRGMRYLLVSHGSVLLEIAIFTVVISVFLTFFFKWLFAVYKPQSLDSLGMTIGGVSATVGIVAWSVTRRLHQKYLAPIIDRQFFRQSYDSHQIITGLAESLRSTSEQQQLLEEVATKIQSALQTESVAIFLKEQRSGNFVSSYYCEYKPSAGCVQACAHNFQLAQSSEVVKLLSGLSKCHEVSELPIPDDEQRILAQIKSALLLPLFGKEQMLGLISLGPRLGDLPFAREDEELLMSVANPVALAIENARLVAQMVEDARHRQALEAENEARAKEFEEARQLQLSMLPRNVPQLPNLDIAAYMKTATEVGGDYYDFHLTTDGTLTIAVGDATGHGLKAGTIVTATKSLFNNLAVLPDIREIFAQSSRALKQMNLRSLYMAMTMMKLKGRELTVSSAGMPAVLIYRAQTNSIEEILLRGMPLGSVKNYPYKQQKFLLETDDVIFAMSDGFEERFAVSGEMLGYERAEQLLLQSAHQSANGIINEFVRIGDEWGSGRPQDDDVTFVVVKIKGD